MNSRIALSVAVLGLSLSACSVVGARPSASPDPSASSAPSPIPPATAGTSPSPVSPSPRATSTARPTDGPVGLAGREFVSVLVTEDGKSIALVPGTKVRVGFSNNSISASAGCNSMSGEYSLEGEKLVVGELAISDMGCPTNLGKQDQWLSDLLSASPTLVLDGYDLVMTSDTTEVTFLDRERAEPDQPLEEITWSLATVIDGDAASSVPAGMDTTLLFDKNGTFTFSDGCNSGGGKYSVDRDTMNLSQVITTAMACDTTKEHSDVTAAIDAMFRADSIKFAIDHATLSLHEISGPHALQYDAALDVNAEIIDY